MQQSRGKGLGVMVGVLFVAFAVLSGIGHFKTRREAERAAETHFETISESTVGKLRALVSPADRILKENVQKARIGLLPIDDPEELGLHFVERIRQLQHVAWISYSDHATGRFVGAKRRLGGNEVLLNMSELDVREGRPREFLVDGRELKPVDAGIDEPYDPRQKDWYRVALNGDGIIWTPPFLFNEGIMGITAAIALRNADSGDPIGVFTVDFFLQQIATFLAELARDHDGYIYVMTCQGDRIAASAVDNRPHADALIAASIDALATPLPQVPSDCLAVAKFRFGQVHYWASFETFMMHDGAPCAVVNVVPANDFVGFDIRRTWWLAAVGLAGLVLAGVFGYLVLRDVRCSAACEGDPATGSPQSADTLRIGSGATTSAPGNTDRDATMTVQLPGALTLSPSDLSGELQLHGAPQARAGGRTVPSLDGIPLLSRLGQGAMATVYFGYHPRLHSEVAVKVMSRMLSGDTDAWKRRFFREAQVAAMLESPHLVRVFDVNEQTGIVFIVMEFVHGISSRQYLKEVTGSRDHGLALGPALDICTAATEGLVAAHQMGVVHRDVKPDNILLPFRDGDTVDVTAAKLADLGLARLETMEGSLTAANLGMGTPGYVAPEQARDARQAGKPADVFGIGATLYCLLTGGPPFAGDTPMATMMKTFEEPHPPVREKRPDLDADVVNVIDRCLHKDPAARYPSAEELLAALTACHAAGQSRG